MPLYQYQCNKCETFSEEFRIMDKRADIEPCDKCNEGEKILKIGAPSITFVGKGFYAVDYKNPLTPMVSDHPSATPTKLTKTV